MRFILWLLLGSATAAAAQEPADLVVVNADIFTADELRSRAQALAVRAGRLVYVGTTPGAERWIGPRTRVVDGDGRLIVPGFHDTHVHLAQAAAEREWCEIGEPRTLEATREALEQCVVRAGAGSWVLVNEANPAVFPPNGPPRGFLDSIEADRPMWVSKLGGHEAYVNRAILELAGIDASTPDPPNGTIVRDDRGRPTGTLRGAAHGFVEERLADHWPEPDAEQVATWIREEFDEAARLGIVSVQEIPAFGVDIPRLYRHVLESDRATPRIRFAQRVMEYAEESAPLEQRVARALGVARVLEGTGANAGTVKIFVDGDLGPMTAALFEPYIGAERDGWSGKPYLSQAELDTWTQRLDQAGFQLQFHAIGDRAIHMALNAIEHAQATNGRRDARHQITHLHVLRSSDVQRFRELGVIANVQPIFADNHEYNTVLTPRILGPERNAWMHRFQDLLASGAIVAVSTDYPVLLLDPLESLQVAVTRREPGSQAPPFGATQRLTLLEALVGYTISGAYANFLDDVSGSLEVGKQADFVMFDRNLFDLTPEQLTEARAVWTVIGGRDAFNAIGR